MKALLSAKGTKQFIWGFLSAAAIIVVFVLGLLAVYQPEAWLSNIPYQSIWHWLHNNLQFALPLFCITAAVFVQRLLHARKLLDQFPHSLPQLQKLESQLDIFTGLFFGIGVIWTAIGMRSALIYALGDLDGTSAASLGAFEILRRLIDGGILLALSTTIVGGIGGYFMRLLKALLLTGSLYALYTEQTQQESAEVLNTLKRIEQALLSRTDNSVPEAEVNSLAQVEPTAEIIEANINLDGVPHAN